MTFINNWVLSFVNFQLSLVQIHVFFLVLIIFFTIRFFWTFLKLDFLGFFQYLSFSVCESFSCWVWSQLGLIFFKIVSCWIFLKVILQLNFFSIVILKSFFLPLFSKSVFSSVLFQIKFMSLVKTRVVGFCQNLSF